MLNDRENEKKYSKLALSYLNYGEKNKASELFLESYHILKNNFPKKHELIGKIVENLCKKYEFSATNYSNWNYIQLFKWIEINKINPKLMEIFFSKSLNGLILNELICLVKNNKEELISDIKKQSNNDISRNDIHHFFSCIEAL